MRSSATSLRRRLRTRQNRQTDWWARRHSHWHGEIVELQMPKTLWRLLSTNKNTSIELAHAICSFPTDIALMKGSCVVRQCFARSWWRQLPDRRIRLQRLVCRRSRGFSLAYMSGSTSPNGVWDRPHRLASNPPPPLSSVRSVRPWALPSWVAARRHCRVQAPRGSIASCPNRVRCWERLPTLTSSNLSSAG